MPSSIGHAIVGATVAWTADLVPGDRRWRVADPWGVTVACAVLAATPDLDLLFSVHRTVTHSIGAVFFVGLFAAALAANAGRPIARVALMCAGAYGSHLLMDWMAVDRFVPYGLQALWPFSRRFYLSGWDVFRQTERRHVFSADAIRMNLLAVAQEVLLLAPIAVLIYSVRVKALAGLSTEATRRDHAAQ